MLLEAMLAMFIFSLGVLGLVGMYTASIKNVTDAQFRTEAAFFAETLIGQLRVADPATRATNYDSPSGTAYVVWKNLMVNSGVPGVANHVPTVEFTGTNSKTVTVHIYWQAKNETLVHQFVAQTVLE